MELAALHPVKLQMHPASTDKESTMDQSNLPRHVVERVERRWAKVLSHRPTQRPEKKHPGMKDPSHDIAKQTPETGSGQPISKRPVWNGLF
jgi:hypothetical protein